MPTAINYSQNNQRIESISTICGKLSSVITRISHGDINFKASFLAKFESISCGNLARTGELFHFYYLALLARPYSIQ